MSKSDNKQSILLLLALVAAMLGAFQFATLCGNIEARSLAMMETRSHK